MAHLARRDRLLHHIGLNLYRHLPKGSASMIILCARRDIAMLEGLLWHGYVSQMVLAWSNQIVSYADI